VFNVDKYSVGETVICQNGPVFQLGQVKEVLPDDRYRVWYHRGDTSAVTCAVNLHKISNAYSFLTIRRKNDVESVKETQARQLAIAIFQILPLSHTICGEEGKAIEDNITRLINDW